MSKITNDGFNPVWHRILYSCTYMSMVGVKGLIAVAGHVRSVCQIFKLLVVLVFAV